ncbi:MAG: amidohydrolase family protein [Firmicutes bacterium]|nr:amidohydrolase family protein [Bacillota bacterium]
MDKAAVINAAVIPGDGETLLPVAAVYIRGDRIEGVEARRLSRAEREELARHRRVIDGEGLVALPGLINHHAHGAVPGPLFPSAEPPPSEAQARENLDRHLAQGVTTIVNVCGFCLPEEAARVSDHPVRVLLATAHLPRAVEAADAVGGRGLSAAHRAATADEMLARGAVALGEIGAGHTLGGGGQDYLYIPQAIRAATGRTVKPEQARALKLAALGRRLDPAAFDRAATARVLEDIGLADVLDPEQARDLVAASVLPPVRAALAAFDDAAEVARRHGTAVIFHNSAPSAARILAVARRLGKSPARIVAAHSNHDTFSVEDSVETARKLRELGVWVDLATFSLSERSRERMGNFLEYFDALAASGSANLISTDYNGGYWDGIPLAIDRMVRQGWASLPQAAAMATANVAGVLGLTDRGRLLPGLLADLTLLRADDLSRVAHVLVGGRVAFCDDAPGHHGS